VALKLKMKDAESYEMPSAGSHQAVCVAVVDLGTQERTFEGLTSVSRQIFLAYEILGETKEDGSPFVVGRDYTFSLNEKAWLRHAVKALRGGKDVSADEEIDLKSLLLRPCIVALEHKQTAGGKDYAKLSGVQPPMKGAKAGGNTVGPVYWEIDSGEPFPEDDWLPYSYGKPLLEVVGQSHEWRRQAAGAAVAGHGEEAF
jgi:hypothetical protein